MSKTKNFTFKIGADPEFVMSTNNKKCIAKETMEIMFHDKPDLEKRDHGYYMEKYGEVGWDGAASTNGMGSTAELRPNANNNPQEVVNNIGGLLKELTKHITICDLSTLSELSSIGGHIHLEIPKGEDWQNDRGRTMHKRLASFYVPLLISENKTNLRLRIKQNYGSMKDYLIKNHFNYDDGTPGYTLEFRVPSAEWLTTPKIAMGTLAYMATVYNEALNNPKNFAKYNDIVYQTEEQGKALHSLAIADYNTLTQGIIKKVKKYIKSFEFYEQYKDEIEYVFNTKQVIKDKEKVNYDIAKGWNLLSKDIPKKSQILSSKKTIQKIAAEKDFDLLKGVMNIHYNDDKNVALFAEALKDRIAAYDWKLKNNYCIFGMRKGIESIITKNLKGEFLTGTEIIKTKLDKRSIDDLFEKMNSKFGNYDIQTETRLDFKTGKLKNIQESIITIGIPYNMRIKENIKDFLSIIWELEKETINVKNLTRLTNDSTLPTASQGILFQILTKSKQSQQQAVMDPGSVSLRDNKNATQNIINEINQVAQNN